MFHNVACSYLVKSSMICYDLSFLFLNLELRNIIRFDLILAMNEINFTISSNTKLISNVSHMIDAIYSPCQITSHLWSVDKIKGFIIYLQ